MKGRQDADTSQAWAICSDRVSTVYCSTATGQRAKSRLAVGQPPDIPVCEGAFDGVGFAAVRLDDGVVWHGGRWMDSRSVGGRRRANSLMEAAADAGPLGGPRMKLPQSPDTCSSVPCDVPKRRGERCSEDTARSPYSPSRRVGQGAQGLARCHCMRGGGHWAGI